MGHSLTLEQVNSWRLTRHRLAHRAPKKELARVVSDVCGVQAQVLSAAELAIRARVEGIDRQDVQAALWRDHALVRTWCMRGTLHVLASSDLPLYVAGLRTKLEESKRWLQKEGATPAEVDAITAEIGRALRNRTLAREDLSHEVERAVDLRPKTRKMLRSAWGVLLRPAAYQGLLAFGESIGPKATFTSPAKWFSRETEPTTKEAFVELFRRFLRCYGPATVGDFAHWWGNLGDGERSTLASEREDLTEVRVGAFGGLMLREDAEEADGLAAFNGVHLLPSFDCYAMFYAPRDLFVSKEHRGRIFKQTAGWNYPAIVVDGKAAGVWNLKRKGREVEVELEAFRPLNPREKSEIVAEVADIGRFLGSPAKARFLRPGSL